MNVLAIGGSACLRSNSHALPRLAVESAESRGDEADVLHARRLSIQDRLSCNGCKASPLWRPKAIIDRPYGLLDPVGALRIEGGKSFNVIAPEGGMRTSGCRQIVGTLTRALGWLRIDLRRLGGIWRRLRLATLRRLHSGGSGADRDSMNWRKCCRWTASTRRSRPHLSSGDAFESNGIEWARFRPRASVLSETGEL